MSKRTIGLMVGGLVGLGLAAVPAQAGWGFSFGFGWGGPAYYAPAVVPAAPVAVYPAPAPVYYGYPVVYSAPVYYGPAVVPARYYWGRPYYYGHGCYRHYSGCRGDGCHGRYHH